MSVNYNKRKVFPQKLPSSDSAAAAWGYQVEEVLWLVPCNQFAPPPSASDCHPPADLDPSNKLYSASVHSVMFPWWLTPNSMDIWPNSSKSLWFHNILETSYEMHQSNSTKHSLRYPLAFDCCPETNRLCCERKNEQKPVVFMFHPVSNCQAACLEMRLLCSTPGFLWSIECYLMEYGTCHTINLEPRRLIFSPVASETHGSLGFSWAGAPAAKRGVSWDGGAVRGAHCRCKGSDMPPKRTWKRTADSHFWNSAQADTLSRRVEFVHSGLQTVADMGKWHNSCHALSWQLQGHGAVQALFQYETRTSLH